MQLELGPEWEPEAVREQTQVQEPWWVLWSASWWEPIIRRMRQKKC
jgi:hypothetical protein